MSNPTQLPLFDPIEISLAGKYITLIDPIDADLAQHRWRPVPSASKIYASRNIHSSGGKTKYAYLHRVILSRVLGREITRYEEVDHINGDSLDNRRANLRLSTHAENTRNRKRHVTNTSGYKGVCWRKDISKWQASIGVNGKDIPLGYYDTPIEAHVAYCQAAIKYFGEFARFE